MLCLLPAADMKCFLQVLSCLAVLGKWLCESVRSMGKFNLPVASCNSLWFFPINSRLRGTPGGSRCVTQVGRGYQEARFGPRRNGVEHCALSLRKNVYCP